MKKIAFFLLLICACCTSTIAGTPSPTPTTPPKANTHKISLHIKSDNKSLRAPSNNPSYLIYGFYEDNGTLVLFPTIDSDWELTISSKIGTEYFNISTDELTTGVYVGVMQEFSIQLSNESGITFVGEFYSEF